MKPRNPNLSLFSKVQRHILAHPLQFNMCEDFASDISGFAVAAAGRDLGNVDCYIASRKLLRITAGQRDALCFLHRWPRRFQRQFHSEPGTLREFRANAAIACERIEHFIKEGC